MTSRPFDCARRALRAAAGSVSGSIKLHVSVVGRVYERLCMYDAWGTEENTDRVAT